MLICQVVNCHLLSSTGMHIAKSCTAWSSMENSPTDAHRSLTIVDQLIFTKKLQVNLSVIVLDAFMI